MKKRFKVRPVDMCIYIDAHIYEKDHNVELIFEYLQNLFYSLSIKQRFFNTEEDYKNYSIYGATQAYLRLTSPKQFLSDDDPKKIPKVKSVLNWIKSVLYAFKVDYQKANFNEVYSEEYIGESVLNIKEDLEEKATETCLNPLLKMDVECYLDSICKTIKDFLKKHSYIKDPVQSKNLYISCLITFLRSITLSNYNNQRLYSKKDNSLRLNVDNLLGDFYYEEAVNAPLVWKLDKDMESYVSVLVNGIKEEICKDIRYLSSYYVPSEELIKDILMMPLADKEEEE